jgi:hypothetical protein
MLEFAPGQVNESGGLGRIVTSVVEKSPFPSLTVRGCAGAIVTSQPFTHFTVRFVFGRNPGVGFRTRILAIKSALAEVFVDSDALNCCLYFIAREDFSFSPDSVVAN